MTLGKAERTRRGVANTVNVLYKYGVGQSGGLELRQYLQMGSSCSGQFGKSTNRSHASNDGACQVVSLSRLR